MQKASAEIQKCLDLVKAKQYAAAIDPCSQAVADSASVEAQRAYDEAKAAVQKEAQAAALDATAGSLTGESPEGASKSAASKALGDLGGQN